MIFGRRGGSGRHARPGEAHQPGPRHAAPDEGMGELGVESGEAYGDEPASAGKRGHDGGPYDVAEAPRDVPRLDLGSLQVPAIEGVEVRVQADPDGQVQQVVLVHGQNALQLGVFAAPKSEGIWDEVRTEIRKSLFNDGVAAEESDGEFGVELRARVRTPDGLTDIRFVGVDGPRWMVRGVYQGPAAVDPVHAGPLAACLRELVVDRGHEAKPVREPLPLRLPRDAANQVAGQQAGAPGEPAIGQGAVTALSPGVSGPVNGAAPSRRKPSPRPRRTA